LQIVYTFAHGSESEAEERALIILFMTICEASFLYTCTSNIDLNM